MSSNLFEEIRERKQHVLSLAEKAKEYGWITLEREANIRQKIENDVLTIGVIGQMKCGKSTVLNSIVFEDDVLPSATTPMTAALSVITYGEEQKIVAEFYNQDEWEEQKMQASRSLSEVAGNTLEESKIKAAKELVEKSSCLGSQLTTLLGQMKEDSLEHLEEYVGADGKYVSITKSVTIYYPKEYLKGVEIVDTPGFNDPIISREERTKAFLNKADVVLLMLYADQPFSEIDRNILFKNVRQCGIGKVLIGINKYDMPNLRGDTEDEIKNYVKEEIKKACKECDDTTLVEILQDTEPIPLSAEMALLSELPMSKISNDEIYADRWKRYCDGYGFSNQTQLKEKSHIDKLMSAIKDVIEKEKMEILLRKPLSAIVNAGRKKKTEVEENIALCKKNISDASQPDEELEERLRNLERADKRLNKKIESLGDDIEINLQNVIRRGKYTLEDDLDSSCNKMDNIVESLKRYKDEDSISDKLDKEKINLEDRTLERHIDEIETSSKRAIQKCVNDFIGEVRDVLLRYVPDFDTRDFIKRLEKNIQFESDGVVNDGENPNFQNEEATSWGEELLTFIGDFFNGASFGTLGLIGNLISYNDTKRQLHEQINELRKIDVSPYLDSILNNKDRVIGIVKTKVYDNMLTPIQNQLQELIANKDNRQRILTESKEKLYNLLSEKALIEKQLAEFD